jgi:glycerol uptake operon antiterminator
LRVDGTSSKLSEFLARLAESPCCAAITAEEHLESALASGVSTLFILRGNGLELVPLVRRVHAAGKLVAVHVDLVDGLRPDRTAIGWLARAGVDAVISSHGQLMPAIQRERMVAIHRLLLVRRSLLDSGLAAVKRSGANIIEVLPGVILPDVIHLLPRMDEPLLAGGFIRTEEEARAALAAGAVGVTTSTESLWGARLG